MKKATFLFILLLCGMTMKAQIGQGKIQLGGTVGISTQKTGDNETSYFNVLPRAGLFVSENTSVGIVTGYSTLKRDVFSVADARIVEMKTNQFVVGAYSRFHKSLADNFYIYLQPSATYATGKSKTDGTETSTSDNITLQVSPGLAYFLSNRFSIEMNIGNLTYSNTNRDAQGVEETTNAFDLNLSLTGMTFGVSYFIK